MRKILISFTLIALILCCTVANGNIASGVTTSVALDSVKEMLTSTIEEATDDMDYSIALAAIRALEAIDSWEKANSNLLDKAFENLDKSTQDIFSNINSTLIDVDGIAKNNISEVSQITTNLNQLSESTILSEKRSYILTQKPMIAPIDNSNFITIRLSGVNLDKADPIIVLEGKNAERRILGPTKVEFDIPKKYLKSSSNKISLTKISVTHQTRESNFLFFFPQYAEVKRELTIGTLPNKIGNYEMEVTRNISKRVVEQYTGDGGKFKGTNTTKSKLIKPKEGYFWLTVDRNKFSVVSTGSGKSGRCKEIEWNNSNKHGITINARLDQRREGLSRSAGYKHCGLKGPIYKDETKVVTEKMASGSLGWSSDELVSLPKGTTSFVLTFTGFDGKEYIASNSMNSDYFKVEKSSSQIIIRPKALSDFL